MNKILVIDDSLEVRENTVELLELEGYKVFSAEDGSKGFKKAMNIVPDLILCDLIMPKTDGMSFYHNLQKDVNLSAIPIIFFSADSKESFIKLPEGSKFLRKPFTSEELFESVKSSLIKTNIITD
jgi:CheY-like chemotaxis protein